MISLKVKILKAEITEDGQAIISVKMSDSKGFSWYKTYNYFTTEKIDISSFKARIKSDIQADLKATEQLEEIKPEIGKEFTISINALTTKS